jgi:hypothetical protein
MPDVRCGFSGAGLMFIKASPIGGDRSSGAFDAGSNRQDLYHLECEGAN